jgi:hypothetical protein
MLIGVLASLFSGLYFLFRDPGSLRTVRVLTLRVGLSIALFVLLLAAYRFGFFGAPGG